MCWNERDATNTKENGEDAMITMDRIETEKTEYLKEMKRYLDNFKTLSAEEAKKVAKKNLIASGIIEEDGKFSSRYYYSRKNEEKRK